MTDWPAILREFGPLVWRCANRILGTDNDSADAFQETFLAAVDLDSRETVRSWPSVLAVLATRQALMLLRTRCRERSRFRPLPRELPQDATDVDPARFAESSELAERLSHLARPRIKLPRSHCLQVHANRHCKPGSKSRGRSLAKN